MKLLVLFVMSVANSACHTYALSSTHSILLSRTPSSLSSEIGEPDTLAIEHLLRRSGKPPPPSNPSQQKQSQGASSSSSSRAGTRISNTQVPTGNPPDSPRTAERKADQADKANKAKMADNAEAEAKKARVEFHRKAIYHREKILQAINQPPVLPPALADQSQEAWRHEMVRAVRNYGEAAEAKRAQAYAYGWAAVTSERAQRPDRAARNKLKAEASKSLSKTLDAQVSSEKSAKFHEITIVRQQFLDNKYGADSERAQRNRAQAEKQRVMKDRLRQKAKDLGAESRRLRHEEGGRDTDSPYSSGEES